MHVMSTINENNRFSGRSKISHKRRRQHCILSRTPNKTIAFKEKSSWGGGTAPRLLLRICQWNTCHFVKLVNFYAGRSYVCVPAHSSLDFSKTRLRLSQMDEVIIQDLPTLYVSSKTSHFSLCWIHVSTKFHICKWLLLREYFDCYHFWC